MTRDDLLAHMRRLDACSDATRWVASQSGSAYDLWRRCDRGDWLLWLAASAGVDRPLVVLAACDCAEPALVQGESSPRLVIETARRWARGEATISEVRSAAAAAADYATCYAAYSTGYSAAYAAASYAYAAADAAYHAADAAYHAASASSSLAQSARLVRERIPWSVVRDALEVTDGE